MEKGIEVNLPIDISNKEFITMHEILKDAEKYLSKDEIETAKALLLHLNEYIERYRVNLNANTKS